MDFYELEDFEEMERIERLANENEADEGVIFKPLFEEVKIAVGLYKESLEKQNEALTAKRVTMIVDTDEVIKARAYMFTFLESIQYEDDLS